MEILLGMMDDGGATGKLASQAATGRLPVPPDLEWLWGTSLTSTEVRWIAFLLPGRVDSGEFPRLARTLPFSHHLGGALC